MQIDSTINRVCAGYSWKAGHCGGEGEETAEHLVLSNLKGHDSHGVGMIPNYVASASRGLKVNADAKW